MTKPEPLDVETFERALERLVNTYSQENASNTPDFLLAQYLIGCLRVWNECVTERERWYGRASSGPLGLARPDASGPG
jgi:hypothetical protein